MYKIYFNDKGQIVAHGTVELPNLIGFQIEEQEAPRAKAVIESGQVVGYEIDESIVIDTETNEVVPVGETLKEKVERLETENLEKTESILDLDFRMINIELGL